MLIDRSKCVGCGNCIPICTMGAISVVDGKSRVNQDECVECNTCYRTLRSEGKNPAWVRSWRWILRQFHLLYDAPPDVCPTGALTPPKLEWPRSLRADFSDPTTTHKSTGGAGRGTEEIKTNDVTGRLPAGMIGFAVELGRPGLGARFSDIEIVAKALAEAGVYFEPNNPVTYLMTDTKTGALRPEVLNEKVMSAIIECRCDAAKVPGVLAALKRVANEVKTVITAGIAARCNSDGSVPYLEAARAAGFKLSLNGKTNLGIGRPHFEERQQAAA